MSERRANAGDEWSIEQWQEYRDRHAAACERWPEWANNVGRACVAMADARLARLRAGQVPA